MAEPTYFIKRNAVLGKGGMDALLKFARMPTSTRRIRGNSLWSRRPPGGIQTAGKVPFRARIARPLASSLSVLFMLPIISLALPACTSEGLCPAFHFIDQPVTVAHALDGDGRASRKRPQEQAIFLPLMLHPLSRDYFPRFADSGKNRVFIMSVTTDLILHAAITSDVWT